MEEIQKKIAQNGPRFLAYLIDIVPIIIMVYATFYYFFDLDIVFGKYLKEVEQMEKGQGTKEYTKQMQIINEVSFSLWLLYCIVMEASEEQGTFGKQLMKIKVVDEYGSRMSLNQSASRNLCKIFSHLAFSIGFLWLLFDKQRQGWHDKLTKTFVVSNDYKEERES